MQKEHFNSKYSVIVHPTKTFSKEKEMSEVNMFQPILDSLNTIIAELSSKKEELENLIVQSEKVISLEESIRTLQVAVKEGNQKREEILASTHNLPAFVRKQAHDILEKELPGFIDKEKSSFYAGDDRFCFLFRIGSPGYDEANRAAHFSSIETAKQSLKRFNSNKDAALDRLTREFVSKNGDITLDNIEHYYSEVEKGFFKTYACNTWDSRQYLASVIMGDLKNKLKKESLPKIEDVTQHFREVSSLDTTENTVYVEHDISGPTLASIKKAVEPLGYTVAKDKLVTQSTDVISLPDLSKKNDCVEEAEYEEVDDGSAEHDDSSISEDPTLKEFDVEFDHDGMIATIPSSVKGGIQTKKLIQIIESYGYTAVCGEEVPY